MYTASDLQAGQRLAFKSTILGLLHTWKGKEEDAVPGSSA